MSDLSPAVGPTDPSLAPALAARLAWGLGYAVPPQAPIAWGARAVFERGKLHLLPDRTDHFGPTDRVKLMCKHLDERALPEARELCQRAWTLYGLNCFPTPTILHQDAYVTLVGSSNQSCGYMYLAAFWAEGMLPHGSPPETFTPACEVKRATCLSCGDLLQEKENGPDCDPCRSRDEEAERRNEEAIADGERRYAQSVLGDEAPDWR